MRSSSTASSTRFQSQSKLEDLSTIGSSMKVSLTRLRVDREQNTTQTTTSRICNCGEIHTLYDPVQNKNVSNPYYCKDFLNCDNCARRHMEPHRKFVTGHALDKVYITTIENDEDVIRMSRRIKSHGYTRKRFPSILGIVVLFHDDPSEPGSPYSFTDDEWIDISRTMPGFKISGSAQNDKPQKAKTVPAYEVATDAPVEIETHLWSIAFNSRDRNPETVEEAVEITEVIRHRYIKSIREHGYNVKFVLKGYIRYRQKPTWPPLNGSPFDPLGIALGG